MNAEAERDQHRDAHNPVQDDAPHHGLGKLDGGVLELLTHMCTSIRTDKAPNRTRKADQAGQSLIPPASSIVELREDLMSRCMIRHDPEDN